MSVNNRKRAYLPRCVFFWLTSLETKWKLSHDTVQLLTRPHAFSGSSFRSAQPSDGICSELPFPPLFQFSGLPYVCGNFTCDFFLTTAFRWCSRGTKTILLFADGVRYLQSKLFCLTIEGAPHLYHPQRASLTINYSAEQSCRLSTRFSEEHLSTRTISIVTNKRCSAYCKAAKRYHVVAAPPLGALNMSKKPIGIFLCLSFWQTFTGSRSREGASDIKAASLFSRYLRQATFSITLRAQIPLSIRRRHSKPRLPRSWSQSST